MGDLVLFTAAQSKREDRLQALWLAYTNARAKAETTLDIQDGIAAGKAWAAWLDLFRAIYP